MGKERYPKTGEISQADTAPGLPEARDKLHYFNMPPSERQAYDEHTNATMIQETERLGNQACH